MSSRGAVGRNHIAQGVRRSCGLAMLVLIRLYQYMLSPVLGANCRYGPTCSAYAYDAVRIHGPIRGGWLAFKRISRCHPWGGAGFDPVPEVNETKANRLSHGDL